MKTAKMNSKRIEIMNRREHGNVRRGRAWIVSYGRSQDTYSTFAKAMKAARFLSSDQSLSPRTVIVRQSREIKACEACQ